jgi:predicted adenylyl cyclase CyaB
MHYEIEIKAHVRDVAKTTKLLDGFASFTRSYDKSDAYYLLPEAKPGEGRNFRIRREEGNATVTWKNRSYQGAMEVNVEREFEVSDPQAFLELCLSMGASPYIVKRKTGRAYEHEGFTIELSEVAPLGYFVEVEKIIDIDEAKARGLPSGPGEGLPHEPDPALIREIRKKEEAILERLRIPLSAIEAKPYSLMLREAQGLREAGSTGA